MAVFRLHVHFSRRKSGTKFLSVKNFQRQSCKAFTGLYLALQKWLVVDVPST